MREPHPGGTQEHDTTALAPAPRASHGGALLATGALLALWVGLTVGAPTLAPRIAALASTVEVALGFDVLPGPHHAGTPEDDGA